MKCKYSPLTELIPVYKVKPNQIFLMYYANRKSYNYIMNAGKSMRIGDGLYFNYDGDGKWKPGNTEWFKEGETGANTCGYLAKIIGFDKNPPIGRM